MYVETTYKKNTSYIYINLFSFKGEKILEYKVRYSLQNIYYVHTDIVRALIDLSDYLQDAMDLSRVRLFDFSTETIKEVDKLLTKPKTEDICIKVTL